MPWAGTKLPILVELLEQEEGATVEEMAAATEWQLPPVCVVMSGVLPKRFGLKIVSEKIEGRGECAAFATVQEPCSRQPEATSSRVLGDHSQEGRAMAVELRFADAGHVRHLGAGGGSRRRQLDQRLVVEDHVGWEVLRTGYLQPLLP